MRILVVGGMGIIGGAITEAACKKGHDVYILSRRNITDYYKKLGAKGIQGDWKNDDFLISIVNEDFDVIVDTLVVKKEELIRDTRLVDGHCSHFIYISTDAVYMHPDENVSEERNIKLDDLKWTYGRNKREAELYLFDEGDNYSFNWTIVRPTMTFGEKRIPVGFGSRKNEWTLVNRIINNKPVLNYDGLFPHAMCHTSTFGDAVVELFGNESVYGECYHISDDKTVVYRDIYNIIGSIVNKSPVVIEGDLNILKMLHYGKYVEMNYDKIPGFTLNNDKIKEVAPSANYDVDIKKAVYEEIEYLKNNYSSTQEDLEYNILTDAILLLYRNSRNDYENMDKIDSYISSLPKDYIRILKLYIFKSRIKAVLRPLYKMLRKAIGIIR
ncbi:NAD-dependent epimerase/dehydratase family protein [Pseudobutyrivibrio sp. MD2005]|uniref:NAD-dependent epimerase/dehydratase family protein n=1 Tax=Pseudobutyrivibrio sp. MD2005 TaxID=1410616 RepID=UPI00048897A3|nr:NAD-dependent epimerase/dehydratase family protein [Pseudobutyrivibrio sp. MD2005]